MAQLFTIGFDSGDFSECTGVSLSGAGSAISVGATGAMCTSPLGCLAEVNAVAGATAFFYKDFSTAQDDLVVRIYFDPNSIVMVNGDNYVAVDVRASLGACDRLFDVYHYRTAGVNQLRILAKDDANANNWGIAFNILDQALCLEMHCERATGVAASDGRLRIWVDTVLSDTIAGLDNWDLFPTADRVKCAFVELVDVGTDGITFQDCVIANDDGGTVGCGGWSYEHPTPAGPSAPAWTRPTTIPSYRQP